MNPDDTQNDSESPYDFILKTDAPDEPKKALISKRKLIFFSVLSLLILAIGAGAYSTYVGRTSIEQREKLLEIAQIQVEISRVAEIASEKSDNEEVRGRAEAIKNSLDESLEGTKSMLEGRGTLPTDEELEAKKNTSIDDQLSQAVEFNNFDKAFDKAINNQLVDYQRKLLSAQKIGNSTEKSTLEAFYNNSNSMLGLVDDPQN